MTTAYERYQQWQRPPITPVPQPARERATTTPIEDETSAPQDARTETPPGAKAEDEAVAESDAETSAPNPYAGLGVVQHEVVSDDGYIGTLTSVGESITVTFEAGRKYEPPVPEVVENNGAWHVELGEIRIFSTPTFEGAEEAAEDIAGRLEEDPLAYCTGSRVEATTNGEATTITLRCNGRSRAGKSARKPSR